MHPTDCGLLPQMQICPEPERRLFQLGTGSAEQVTHPQAMSATEMLRIAEQLQSVLPGAAKCFLLLRLTARSWQQAAFPASVRDPPGPPPSACSPLPPPPLLRYI